MMTNVWTLCINTFREAIRDRILYVLAIFAVVIILLSKALGWVSIGEDLKVITDMGLMALSLFGALIVIFLGTGLIYKEVDKRTIYVVLSRPVSRGEFILGKYFGLLLTTFTVLAGMALFFLLYAFVLSLFPSPETDFANQQVTMHWGPVLLAIVFIFLEMILLTAIAILFSSATSPILSAVFTSMAYVTGHLADRIYDMAQIIRHPPGSEEGGSELGANLMMGVFYLFPNLDVFNIRNEAAHGLIRDYPYPYPGLIMLYALFQTAVFLGIAMWLFRRRSF